MSEDNPETTAEGAATIARLKARIREIEAQLEHRLPVAGEDADRTPEWQAHKYYAKGDKIYQAGRRWKAFRPHFAGSVFQRWTENSAGPEVLLWEEDK